MFTRSLQIIAGAANCVLLVDDLETIDEATQSYLRSLHTGNTPEQRFFIVVGTRVQEDLVLDNFGDEPVASTGACPLLDDVNLPTITLKPMDAADTARVVATILPTLRVDEVYIEQLHQLSSGNVMYIEEALKYLIQVQRLVFERSAWQPRM